MKFKRKLNVEFITIWLGAVVAATVVIGVLLYLASWWTKQNQARLKHNPKLADVSLKVPDFDVVEEAEPDDADLPFAGRELPSASVTNTRTDWSYTGSSGPEFWSHLNRDYQNCNGNLQSPVDLPMNAEPSRDFQPVRFIYKDLPAQLFNEGALLRLKPTQGHVAILFDETFHLAHMEFHVPSEHHLNGVRYDMEIQLYHRNIANQWAVIAVMANEARQTHSELRKLIAAIPKQGSAPADFSSIMPSKFLPSASTYLHYSGSLTSPPCSDGVRWLVMTEPISVSDAQIDTLSKVKGFTARPLQALAGRTVYKSWR